MSPTLSAPGDVLAMADRLAAPLYKFTSNRSSSTTPDELRGGLSKRKWKDLGAVRRREVVQAYVAALLVSPGATSETVQDGVAALASSVEPLPPALPTPAAPPASPSRGIVPRAERDLPGSPSGYYVACGNGCGQLLPAPGPRAVLRFVSGHRPKRKHHTPRVAA